MRSTVLRVLVVLIGMCLAAGAASAQAISACQQSVQYNLAPPAADVPAEFRAFSGVWSGSWGNQLCSVLIVEDVAKDGTVQTKYVNGTNPAWNINRPGVRAWSGKVINGVLVLRGNNVSAEYKLANASELAGTYTGAGPQTTGRFKKQ